MWKWRQKTNNESFVSSEREFFLSSKTVASGKIITTHDIYLDGKFNGSIKSPGLVQVGKNADTRAELKARSLIVEGRLITKASIKESASIRGAAWLKGSISSSTVEVHSGAQLDAKLTTQTD